MNLCGSKWTMVHLAHMELCRVLESPMNLRGAEWTMGHVARKEFTVIDFRVLPQRNYHLTVCKVTKLESAK